MRIVVPDYYDRFSCLAGACPHSCCEKWEVNIDEEHTALYQKVEGALGEKLRGALQQDDEGDFCFALHGDRCPFLDGENLCEIHRALGAEATSVTCQEHPRFTEDYGAFREITLSASCPAANDLLLESEEPLTFREIHTEEPEEEGDEWLPYLLPLRETMLAALTNRDMDLRQRLGAFLGLAEEAQCLLDEEQVEALPGLTADGNIRLAAEEEVVLHGLRLLRTLEPLDADWHELLETAEQAQPKPQSEHLLERIAVYFAFRYLLKTVNDGDLLSRAQFCVLAVLLVERLAAVCGLPEALRRFSCEIEHNDAHLEAVLAAFWQQAGLAPQTARGLSEV